MRHNWEFIVDSIVSFHFSMKMGEICAVQVCHTWVTYCCSGDVQKWFNYLHEDLTKVLWIKSNDCPVGILPASAANWSQLATFFAIQLHQHMRVRFFFRSIVATIPLLHCKNDLSLQWFLLLSLHFALVKFYCYHFLLLLLLLFGAVEELPWTKATSLTYPLTHSRTLSLDHWCCLPLLNFVVDSMLMFSMVARCWKSEIPKNIRILL